MLQRADWTLFDCDGAGTGEGIFGLPYSSQESSLVLLPVAWEATTSYSKGTAAGPAHILGASPQLDLLDAELGQLGLSRPWEFGISMLESPQWLQQLNAHTRALAEPIIAAGGGDPADPRLAEINSNCQRVHQWVAEQVRDWRSQGKWVGLVGGEHSTALGAVLCLSEEYPDLGVLQIDAHADLRQAYEGFTYSHASIMHNVLTRTSARLVQVGIRDFCDSEYQMATQNERITTFWDYALKDRLFQGQSWHDICTDIVARLPERVYVSFDIDGLEAWLCPHTGTPVPGGLSFHQATYLLKCLVQSGRQMVGFDLNEVAPGAHGEWDGNVGARVLYKLCGLLLYSQGGRDR